MSAASEDISASTCDRSYWHCKKFGSLCRDRLISQSVVKSAETPRFISNAGFVNADTPYNDPRVTAETGYIISHHSAQLSSKAMTPGSNAPLRERCRSTRGGAFDYDRSQARSGDRTHAMMHPAFGPSKSLTFRQFSNSETISTGMFSRTRPVHRISYSGPVLTLTFSV